MERSLLDKAVRAFSVVVGAVTLAFGIWAFVAPQSFFEQVATFEPYNRHLLHDVGAFQAGLGVALVIAPFWRNTLGVALGAYAASAVLHAISHAMDTHLGGRATDPVTLGILAALVVAALVAWTSHTRERSVTTERSVTR